LCGTVGADTLKSPTRGFAMRPLALLVVALAPAVAADPPKPIKVEFRWLETAFTEGLTEKTGSPITCGGDDYFPHLKAVLTAADVTGTQRTSVDVGNGPQYAVGFTLSKDARKKLAEGCGDAPGRWLTAYADGHAYGAAYFDKAKPDKFTAPSVGFTPNKELIDRVIEGCKKP
jgi:hypothetical protein